MEKTATKSSVEAYIGLGSNLDNPQSQLKNAYKAIEQISATTIAAASSLYQTKPLGPQDQPDFVNAVICIQTALPALDLLCELQQIENNQGRIRQRERWGPRTLDLDLLLYGKDTIDHPQLTVPHAEMRNRSFVLYPLYEISPNLIMPDKMPLQSLLDKCPQDGLQLIPVQLSE